MSNGFKRRLWQGYRENILEWDRGRAFGLRDITITERKNMEITEKQRQEMLEAARPLLKWHNDNCHPHCRLIVDANTIELIEGVATNSTDDYLKD